MFRKLAVFSYRVRSYLRRQRIPGIPRSRRGGQYGQDWWLLSVLRGCRNGYFVELGAMDGLHNSNTILLEESYGWTGLCIEPHPESFGQLVRNRSCACSPACVDGEQHEVSFHQHSDRGMSGIVDADTDNRDAKTDLISLETVTLEEVLDEHAAPSAIDYLSLDTEGTEFRILQAFDFKRYRFRCMTIERCPEALHRLLSQHGYLLVAIIRKRNGRIIDYGYVHGELVSPLPRVLAYESWA